MLCCCVSQTRFGAFKDVVASLFAVKTEPMSSSEIASSVADTSLDSFSGSGEVRGSFVCLCVWLPLSNMHTAAQLISVR